MREHPRRRKCVAWKRRDAGAWTAAHAVAGVNATRAGKPTAAVSSHCLPSSPIAWETAR